MAASQQRTKVNNRAALNTLMGNIHSLRHPDGMIKHPYFDERFSSNSAGVREMKRKFCEAVILLLEENGHVVDPDGKTAPRRSAAAKESK